MKQILFITLALAVALFIGCSEEQSPTFPEGVPGGSTMDYLADPCGDPTVVDLLAGQYIDAGDVTVENSEDSLGITLETTDNWYITESHVHVALTMEEIPQKNGNPQPGQFDYSHYWGTYPNSVQLDEYAIELEYEPGTTVYIAVHAALEQIVEDTVFATETGWGEGPEFPGKNWAMYIMYEIQQCEPQNPPQEPGYRTQTQGGWGSTPNGGNPGAYLLANWNYLDNPLVIGNGYTITLSSAEAVANFLPQGGPAASLDHNYVDPLTTSAGVFAGQVTALNINVQFDYAIESFGSSATNLGTLVYDDDSSPLDGLTVDVILAEANLVLGGGAATYGETISQLNEAVSNINENFVDGTTNLGWLIIP